MYWRYDTNLRVLCGVSVIDAAQFEGYSRLQSVKVGPGQGPVYGGSIGGKFYDLTALRKRGFHLKQYRLNEGAW